MLNSSLFRQALLSTARWQRNPPVISHPALSMHSQISLKLCAGPPSAERQSTGCLTRPAGCCHAHECGTGKECLRSSVTLISTLFEGCAVETIETIDGTCTETVGRRKGCRERYLWLEYLNPCRIFDKCYDGGQHVQEHQQPIYRRRTS